MTDAEPPPQIARLWRLAERSSVEARPSLSLDRIVAVAIELADSEGIAAVTMSRVARRLGFTTMALYRHVDSKEELLLLMMNTALGEPADPDAPVTSWREGLERWAWELLAIVQRHPWGYRVPLSQMIGPSQLAWLDYGLRALAGTSLSEGEKADAILLLNGYVFWQARLFEELGGPGAGAETGVSNSELLAGLMDAERFPALHRALDARIFDDPPDEQAEFAFGLARVLDGIERLVLERDP